MANIATKILMKKLRVLGPGLGLLPLAELSPLLGRESDHRASPNPFPAL